MVGEYVKICEVGEIEEGKTKLYDLGDRPIIVGKWKGEIFALDGICTHDGGDIGPGEIVDRQIECPRHGARFDVLTGAATRLPAIGGLMRYKLELRGNNLFVELPE